ncbi:MAG TPA: amino acid ABC transporter substrate-binding protein [Gemmatimonadales bacterium]|jgi:putrescine:ornithine antiporter|nr:amino acid ABC transporter substrate-binding protein [Gemmatimonadales bacterium]
MAAWAIALTAMTSNAFGQVSKKTAPAAGPQPTLTRVQKTGILKLGYRTDARPFSYRDEAGKPAGYSVELCQTLAEAVNGELGKPVKAEWVTVSSEDQLRAVQQHDVDILCGAQSVTLERRKQVEFSIPVFPGGVGVLVRSDAPRQLRNILAGKARDYTPTWRAVALNILREQVFATVPGTTAEEWVKQRGKELQVESKIIPVPSYDAGVQAVLERQASAFFGERAILLDAARRNKSARSLSVLDRLFTYEPLALAIGRDDEDFRLVVDRTLSHLYASPAFVEAYEKWFGEPDETTITFFRWNALPD